MLDEFLTREAALARRSSVRPPVAAANGSSSPERFAALKVATENVGDHIQILAGLRLLDQLGIRPDLQVDRDDEISSAPQLAAEDGPVGILLNGWFKTNPVEWPPHPKLLPLLFGFHIRLSQAPSLLSPAALDFYRQHEPVGCRDVHTEQLLHAHGVEAFTSNCLSLTLPRRIARPEQQTEVFVVSRDERIREYMPASLGHCTFRCHYTGTTDFEANMARAEELLETYRARAGLVITTLLHCALPAIAMGIPVIALYPINDPRGHASDRERFSSLERLIPVHHLTDLNDVDWHPAPVDVSALKLQLIDQFFEMARARWSATTPMPLGPVAPSDALPPP